MNRPHATIMDDHPLAENLERLAELWPHIHALDRRALTRMAEAAAARALLGHPHDLHPDDRQGYQDDARRLELWDPYTEAPSNFAA